MGLKDPYTNDDKPPMKNERLNGQMSLNVVRQ